MLKQYFLLLIGLSIICLLGAQNSHTPEQFCANQQGRSKWLKQYQLHPEAYPKGGDTTIYVPMTIHILGTDAGVGYYSVNTLLEAFCTLNTSFQPAGIQFFMAGDIRYHNNSDYYQHETVLEGAEMMFELNVPNTLNTYFVSDPAGNCGYNLPYAGIANAIGCSSANDITWSHEVGHGLSLPHPFLGWEGGISWDGSLDHAFSDPAPERVTYDYTFFQDTLILDTVIIDTAYVERVDGSNCTFAADGFCDTNPDYLAARWTCNSAGVSSIIQHDPEAESFQSDGSLIMNYANDVCQTRFSPEQQAAMRAFILDQRPEWVSTEVALPPITSEPTLTSPDDGELVYGQTAELIWEEVEDATHYLIQVSRLNSFPPALTNSYVSTDNSFITDILLDDRTYYWRVRAYNPYQSCSDFSMESRSFTIDFSVNNHEISELDQWLVYPQPLAKGKQLHISWEMNQSWEGRLELSNLYGQKLYSENIHLAKGGSQLQLPTAELSAGIYYLLLTKPGQQQIKKVIIQ